MGSQARKTIVLSILRCCCHAVLVCSVAGGFGTPSLPPILVTSGGGAVASAAWTTRASRAVPHAFCATPRCGHGGLRRRSSTRASCTTELRMARKKGAKSPPKSRKIPRRGRRGGGGGGRRPESEGGRRRRSSSASASSSSVARRHRRRRSETDDDEATFSTALAIVPPDRAWDTIQRARHMARDASYHRWPPAIRLFHPFVPRKSLTDAAVDVAKLIERREVTPFEVTLDRLLVLPHFEALDERFDALGDGGDEEGEGGEEDEAGGGGGRGNCGPDEEVSALIASEERKGKDKLRKRLEAERQKRREKEGKVEEADDGNDPPEGRDALLDDASERTRENDFGGANGVSGDGEGGDDPGGTRERAPSPREVVERQRAMRKQFNGPCVVCLEPDDESKDRIKRLRELLRAELFESYNPFSVSSSVSDNDSLPRSTTGDGGGGSFRPVLPIGRFPTVERAVNLARRLQNLWEPLKFNVTDLHLIGRDDERDRERAAEAAASRFAAAAAASSSSEPTAREDGGRVDGSIAAAAEEEEVDLEDDREHWLRNRRRSGGASSSSSATEGSEERSLSSRGQYGCDAMVMLVGEEVASVSGKEAEEEERLVLDLLMSEAGQEGGGAKSLQLDRGGKHGTGGGGGVDGGVREDGGGDDVDVLEEEWEDFLDDDDDWDEGATIVIGRTHFFLGEMRQYVGMPASSTMDGKDRVLGDSVSAVARRKGSVHRQGDRWKEGEFGHKERDYLP